MKMGCVAVTHDYHGDRRDPSTRRGRRLLTSSPFSITWASDPGKRCGGHVSASAPLLRMEYRRSPLILCKAHCHLTGLASFSCDRASLESSQTVCGLRTQPQSSDWPQVPSPLVHASPAPFAWPGPPPARRAGPSMDGLDRMPARGGLFPGGVSRISRSR